ncbi:uncharacterized protein LOC127439031 isoform X2 [Myxocyprinus asiaticus]|uniref:uncharacterized protein LOC127439031 isoform X2 n=1 Tax=Myxocyprinus asiaticus TaxID=70543 RepID=UPI002223B2E3|nr:uncharacterized protein LOC127439031 isoform X2 [Myxocyprinus asiaticus]
MSFSEEQSERADSPVFSSVSLKSDQSKDDVVNFSKETPSATKSERADSPVFSSVSLKSDQSKDDVVNFSKETPSATKSERADSLVLSSVSQKSDQSKDDVPNFSKETPSATKSNQCWKQTVNICSEFKQWKTLKAQKGLKSDAEVASYLLNRVQHDTSDSYLKIQRKCKDLKENLLWIFQVVKFRSQYSGCQIRVEKLRSQNSRMTSRNAS